MTILPQATAFGRGNSAQLGRPGMAWELIPPVLGQRHESRTVLFDQNGTQEITRIELPEYTDEIWHGYLPDAWTRNSICLPCARPHEPEKGHRFNPNKLSSIRMRRRISANSSGDLSWFGYTWALRRRSDLR